ncbi:dirigent protein 23 [Cryptomeria japonica]|uniref:dirigent protein 23 n=1 Tax=Cryptomeria japonica TaxID=3369 RepID=UPI0025AB9258|nr:dirigent protein 23 [Cryptomeria japonica]
MGKISLMGILMTLVVIWFCFNIVNVSAENHKMMLKEKVTSLQFYMHDVVYGENATAVQVAPQAPMNYSSGASFFGPLYVIDDPLTETPDPRSRILGRAQGMYCMSSLGEFSLLMALTYSIDTGKFKGSSLSIVGKNMVLRDQRELPVVGGSGHFRMARGYAFAHTHSIQGPNAVIGYNVTIFHYGP